MTLVLILAAVAVAAFLLDRLLVWCELRGWIYYRLTPRQRHSAIGNTLLAIEELYRPSRRHVIEMRYEERVRREEDDDGDRPPDGSAADGRMSPARAASADSPGCDSPDPAPPRPEPHRTPRAVHSSRRRTRPARRSR